MGCSSQKELHSSHRAPTQNKTHTDLVKRCSPALRHLLTTWPRALRAEPLGLFVSGLGPWCRWLCPQRWVSTWHSPSRWGQALHLGFCLRVERGASLLSTRGRSWPDHLHVCFLVPAGCMVLQALLVGNTRCFQQQRDGEKGGQMENWTVCSVVWPEVASGFSPASGDPSLGALAARDLSCYGHCFPGAFGHNQTPVGAVCRMEESVSVWQAGLTSGPSRPPSCCTQ